MSEDDLLSCVLDMAATYGWRRYHQRPNRLGQIVQGDKGYPDLTLVKALPAPALPPNSWLPQEMEYQVQLRARELLQAWSPPRILFVELKSDRGRVSPEQQAWLDALSPYSAVWTPREWRDGTIERSLR